MDKSKHQETPATPHVLVIRHVSFEHLGTLATIMSSAGIAFVYSDAATEGERPVELKDWAALILLGGPMSANDSLPFILQELRLIEKAVTAGVPVLGICLGAQLIAKALGAKVYRNPDKEIGWGPIYWTEEAAQDPLCRGVRNPLTVLHWHGETFDLPREAVLLASSATCQNQAVRFRQGVYGFQFHLEVTPGMVSDWLQQEVNCSDAAQFVPSVDPASHFQELERAARVVYGRWCELLKRRLYHTPL